MVDKLKNQEPCVRSELSVVDMAVTIIRRRRAFLVASIVVFFAALGFAVLPADEYEYTSLVQLAKDAEGETIEPVDTLVETFERRWLPQVERSYETEFGEMPFEVNFKASQSGEVIRLTTLAADELSSKVEEAHSELLDVFMKRQELLVKRQQQVAARQIQSLQELRSSLGEARPSSDADTSLAARIAELQVDADALIEAEVIAVSKRSFQPKGPHRLFIVAVGILLGIVIGVLTVLLLEFGSAVKTRLRSGEPC